MLYFNPISDEVSLKESVGSVPITRDEHKAFFLDAPPLGKERKKNTYPFLFVDAVLENHDAECEHLWVEAELRSVDVQLMYHWTNDTSRMSATEDGWRKYAVNLRNYTSYDENVGYTINEKSRPEPPTN